jgi:hypothetical protein
VSRHRLALSLPAPERGKHQRLRRKSGQILRQASITGRTGSGTAIGARLPKHLITFQVMRRSLGTHLSGHGTLKDTQGALRHASIKTTGNVYVQVVEENVMRAINSHATTVLDGWTPAVEDMGLTGRNIKRLPAPTQAT